MVSNRVATSGCRRTTNSNIRKQKTTKRWKKGDSCVSNPTCKKHRNLITSKKFALHQGNSNLTEEAVRKLDSLTEMAEPMEMIDNRIVASNMSVKSFDTLKTFASDWSECTNMSFSKFLNRFETNSILHKEMLAVLAAITEVIKTNKGSESATEYYAALMSALETCPDSNNDLTQTAIVYLLSILIKSVPENVKKQQFSTATKILLSYLEMYAQSDRNMLLKSLLNLLGQFLKCLDDISWSEQSVQHTFRSILVFSLSPKPKIRKVAQKSIFLLLSSRSNSNGDITSEPSNVNLHPVCELVSEFCVQQIQCSKNEITMLFVMNLLKFIIPYFNQSSIKKICESMLRIMTTNCSKINLIGFQVISSLFSSKIANMSAILNGQIISALYDYQPNLTDIQLTSGWLEVMEQAHLHLAQLDLKICSNALPKIMTTVTKMWLSDQDEIIEKATNVLIMLFKHCVSLICERMPLSDNDKHNLQTCFNIIENGLSFQSNQAWIFVLNVIQVMFHICGKQCASMLEKCIKTLAQLRESRSNQFVNEFDNCIGFAIKWVGIETVLRNIPICGKNNVFDINMSWMLPLLKANLENSSIAYFQNNILLMAMNTKMFANHCENDELDVSKHYNLAYTQLWSLLPCFCKNASDVPVIFPKMAQQLGILLKTETDIRFSIMEALRKLIKSDNEEDRQTMSKYATNYIPILLNIYMTENAKKNSLEEAQKNAAFETVKVYFTIADDALRLQYVGDIFNKMQLEAVEKNNIAEQLMALMTILIHYQDAVKLNELYHYCQPFMLSKKFDKMQKKSYRLFDSILKHFESCKLVKSNIQELRKFVLKSADSVCVPSRRYRLNCLITLLQIEQPISKSNFLKLALHESIVCLKDSNKSCRLTALRLLKQIAFIMIEKNAVEYFLTLIVSKFSADYCTSNQLEVISSILAITAVMRSYPDDLGINHVHEIVTKISEHLQNSDKSLVRVSLQFIRIFCRKYSVPQVAPMLKLIVESISNMCVDCRNKLRLGVKYVLSLLIDKFGNEMVLNVIPKTNNILLKMVSNMRKIERRKERSIDKSTVADNETEIDLFSDNESDIIDDDMNSVNKSHRSIKLRKRDDDKETMIFEDDEIVDFMEPKSFKSLSFATKESGQCSRNDKKVRFDDNTDEFKISNDGRIVIEDGKKSIERDLREKLTFKDNTDNDDCSDVDNDDDDMFLSSTKMKLFESKSMKSVSVQSSKRTNGSLGIHRASSSSATKKQNGAEYRSTKSNGDVKQSNRLEPYAYIPMDRQLLNKRKRKKVIGELKNVIRSAKKGAKAGKRFQTKKKPLNKDFIKFQNN